MPDEGIAPPTLDWRLVAQVFDRALDAPEADRPRVLAGVDRAIAARVSTLLEEYVASDAPPRAPWLPADLAGGGSTLGAGDRLGHYEILREIGHGGMGSVFEAVRRDEDFEKRVAIKTIAVGRGSALMEEHFRRERRIVARLEHPNVVTLFDGGLAADGTPWFAMEFVDGEPIDRYCARRRLSLKHRARLLIDVAQGVHYAHQHLVVHRDLKPGNILVTGTGLVKVLDFGIARLLDDEGTERPTLDPVTIPYASPEQLRGQVVTTQSDVFALGIVAAVVVSGRHPFGDDGVPLADLRERVLSGTPRPLGTGTDLDAIVRKALERDPANRYASVELFALDLRRFVSDEPVSARGSGLRYRTARFVRRHRWPVAAATAATGALIGALIWSRDQAARLAVERDRASVEAARATRITEFVQTMLRSADPRAGGPGLTVADALVTATARADSVLAADPLTHAGVLTAIGESYRGLGLLDRAERALQRASAVAARTPGNATTMARVLLHAGLVAGDQGRGESAESSLVAAEASLRQAPTVDSALLASILTALGDAQQYRGDLDRAERTQRLALDLALAVHGEGSVEAAESMNNLAVLLGQRGRWVQAESLHLRALAIVTSRRGETHPDVAAAYNSLASVAEALGKRDDAERHYRRALALRQATLGPDHQEVAWSYTNLGYLLLDTGRPDEARHYADSTAGMRARGVLAADHPMVASALVLHGRSLMRMGRAPEAVTDFRAALALRERSLPADHWLLGVSRSLLGEALARSGDRQTAMPLLASGYEQLVVARGQEHPLTRDARRRLDSLRAP